MSMIIQFYIKTESSGNDENFRPIEHTIINLTPETALMIPEAGETVRFFEYIKGLKGLEWTKKNLRPNSHIVEKIEKVFQQDDKGDVSMRIHVFLSPEDESCYG